MQFPIHFNWTSPFSFKWMLVVNFQLYSNFHRIFCKQTAGNMIRRRILRRVIWLCTVCRCPIKRTPGLNGLSIFIQVTNNRFFGIQCGPMYILFRSIDLSITLQIAHCTRAIGYTFRRIFFYSLLRSTMSKLALQALMKCRLSFGYSLFVKVLI